MSTLTSPSIDVEELHAKVQAMYEQVAREPHQRFHFELGRDLALKLGYLQEELNGIPTSAVDSFAGVGYHFDLADVRPGQRVLDLGSGSGMDAFIAGTKVGSSGAIIGLDMTDAQLEKARMLADQHGYAHVSFVKGYLENLPFDSGTFDVVISNGVINLCADKGTVFREIARVLRPGGRFAISDILTEKPLTDNIVCDTTLWAACIGGATQQDQFREYVEEVGFTILEHRDNPEYQFISRSAQGATRDFGVKSSSISAIRH